VHSVRLQGARTHIASLSQGLTALAIDLVAGWPSGVWLQSLGAQSVFYIQVSGHEIEPGFEVFTLCIEPLISLQSRCAHKFANGWSPEPPLPPAILQPWPFRFWRTQVIRRTEFIVEAAEQSGILGKHPVTQAAARRGYEPPSANTRCDVAVGLLFTGSGRNRLLIAADWFPYRMVVSDQAGEIDAYLECCDTIDLDSYLAHRE
jgi:hypothetical protein